MFKKFRHKLYVKKVLRVAGVKEPLACVTTKRLEKAYLDYFEITGDFRGMIDYLGLRKPMEYNYRYEDAARVLRKVIVNNLIVDKPKYQFLFDELWRELEKALLNVNGILQK